MTSSTSSTSFPSMILDSSPIEIFQSYSLHEIQIINTQLSNKIIKKHDEIRQLVGSKYRDLLITADEIKHMEKLSGQQDKLLYDLVFGKTNGVGGSGGVGVGIENFMKNGLKRVENGNKDSDRIDNVGKVIKNSDFYIKLSKFLKISDDDDDDEEGEEDEGDEDNKTKSSFSINEIEHRIDSLGPKESWGNKKEVIMEKFKEIEVILINKIWKFEQVEQLSKLQLFLIRKNDFFYNIDKFNEILYSKLFKLINNDDVLREILKFFKNFKLKFEVDFINKISSILIKLNKFITQLNDNDNGIDKCKKLSLYELEMNDDYLTNIDYLSKGLIYNEYQIINKEIIELQKFLQYLKLINEFKYNQFNQEFISILNNFKNHAVLEKNQLLIKYLSNIS